jgi:hypothetical protein
MRKLTMVFWSATLLLLGIPTVLAQAPAGEHCAFTASSNPATAIPPYVGTGTSIFSPNQNLCLPQLAPVGGTNGPVAFIVQGVEPGDRVDSQGTIYVVSIRGVPGGIDLWRWSPLVPTDGPPNGDNTLPFKYEGQPDNCGIFFNTGCVNNVGFLGNLGVAPGGGDADIAVNAPPGVPNLAVTSLSLAPGVTGTHSMDRGDTYTPPNPVVALVPGDDRQWNDAIDTLTVYLEYHDLATFNIEVQRSNDGGFTYVNGLGEGIDPQTFPAAGGVPATNSANVAGQTRIDHSPTCPSRGNLYQIFVAPDSVTENLMTGPLRSVYVGVSTDAKMGLPAFTFTDHKIFTSPTGSPGATFGTGQVFPALATDDFGFVYAVWSDNNNIFFSSSGNQGTTWTTPLQVNQGAAVGGKSNVFPWVAADAYGHVWVVWLGETNIGSTSTPANSNRTSQLAPTSCSDITTCWANWKVYAAETVNGNAGTPSFIQYTASDHVIHYGTVSTGGLGGAANRNLADFFQVALDPQHRANISFADDHVPSPLCTSQSTGHCDAKDPQTYRTGQPYFTYQKTASSGIITSGSCAGSPPPPPPGAEKITGGGTVQSQTPTQTANFGFVANSDKPNASLSYHDDGATGGSVDVHSANTSVPTMTFSGNCGTFSGDAKVNQKLGYKYTVNACDNAEPGAGKDTFFISVSGPMNFNYSNGGPITSGNIQIHKE